MITDKTQDIHKVTLKNKISWIKRLLASDMSLGAKVVGSRLAYFHHEESGRCNPRQETIANAVNLKRQAVNRALGELERAGWIGSKQTRGACHYTINLNQADISGEAEESLQGDTSEEKAPIKESSQSYSRSRSRATAGVLPELQQVYSQNYTEPLLQPPLKTTMVNLAPGGDAPAPGTGEVEASTPALTNGGEPEWAFDGRNFVANHEAFALKESKFPNMDLRAAFTAIDALMDGREMEPDEQRAFINAELERIYTSTDDPMPDLSALAENDDDPAAWGELADAVHRAGLG